MCTRTHTHTPRVSVINNEFKLKLIKKTTTTLNVSRQINGRHSQTVSDPKTEIKSPQLPYSNEL